MENQNQKPVTALSVLRDQLPTIEKIITMNVSDHMSPEKIKALAVEEITHVQAMAISKPEILECTPLSVALAVRNVLKNNLSLDPSAGLVYVKTRNVATVENGQKVWKKVLDITPSANGLISIARQCGRVLDIKRPQVKYNAEGRVCSVSVDILLPSYQNPRWETFEFDESDFMRWRTASHKENGRNKADADAVKLNYANPNYINWKGGIDPEFARAKSIRHGLKKLGTNRNEANAVKIQPTEIKQVITVEEMEKESSDTYSEYTEVGNDHVDTNTGEVLVTTHEIINTDVSENGKQVKPAVTVNDL